MVNQSCGRWLAMVGKAAVDGSTHSDRQATVITMDKKGREVFQQ